MKLISGVSYTPSGTRLKETNDSMTRKARAANDKQTKAQTPPHHKFLKLRLHTPRGRNNSNS